MLSILRSHTGENGDDLPIIEFNALKALAFVADAFLMFIDMLEKFDAKMVEGKPGIEKNTADAADIDMFQKMVGLVSLFLLCFFLSRFFSFFS